MFAQRTPRPYPFECPHCDELVEDGTILDGYVMGHCPGCRGDVEFEVDLD